MDVTTQNLLLQLARQSIKEQFSSYQSEVYHSLKKSPPPELTVQRGAFVTLTTRSTNTLRGCIGHIISNEPLYALVYRLAKEAAFYDPRFEAVRERELDDIHLEISVLTPPQKVDHYTLIEVGRDGIILTSGYKRAVFLPQVASEQGWDLETTLEHLARKAGIYDFHKMKEECTYEVFQAEIWGEK
ncbi:MAG: AmmeMemoRadiSam system protein A [Sphaerochaetaceae bacterium]|jgi:AmmeMemoRadiSam system protein A